jgi:hypothetical protein
MRGLDPRIHLLRKSFLQKWMDCRVKPGNDDLMPMRERREQFLLDSRFRGNERSFNSGQPAL